LKDRKVQDADDGNRAGTRPARVESEWQGLEEQLADSPRNVLPELDELVARMLQVLGFAVTDPIERPGNEAEVVAEFLAAHETMLRSESDPDTVSPGDVAAAVNGYRAVFESVLAEREPG
jgi:hypothetical protein